MTKHRLDRTMDDFGGELARAAQASPQRAPRRLRLGLAAGAATAAAATALLAWPGADEASGPDVIAQARAALAPGDEIVHMVLTSSSRAPRTVSPLVKTELWSAEDPTRWRVVSRARATAIGPGGRFGPRTAKSRLSPTEQSFADGELRTYVPRDNSMSIERGMPGVGESPAIGPFGGDPDSRLRDMLDSGQLRDAGTVQSGGRTVRRLVGTTRGANKDGSPRAVTFDIDPESFIPIAGSSTIKLSGDRRIVRRFRVDRYERLPLNERTAKLLRIATDADTKVVVSDATP